MIAAVELSTGAVVVIPKPTNILQILVAAVLVSVIEKSKENCQPASTYIVAGYVAVAIKPERAPSATETVGQLIRPDFLVLQFVLAVAIAVKVPPIAVIWVLVVKTEPKKVDVVDT